MDRNEILRSFEVGREVGTEARCCHVAANERCAVRERHPHFFDRAIEAEGEALENAILGGRGADFVERGNEVHDVAMLRDHAFGTPGRTGRKQDIADVAGVNLCLVPGQTVISERIGRCAVTLDGYDLRAGDFANTRLIGAFRDNDREAVPLRRCNAAGRPAATARSAHRPRPPSAPREWLRSATRSDPAICRRKNRSRRRGCADTAPSCSLRQSTSP